MAEDTKKNEEKSEEQFAIEIKDDIKAAALQVAQKVNKSALNYMVKQKKWVPETNLSEAEQFFNDKIPKVISDEITTAISKKLGI
ncbi:hypothetical protein ACFL2K_02660 [Candidatus Margulisiibacteriota bacterium]